MSREPSGSAPTGAGSQGPAGVVWDLGNVLIDWDPWAAIAAGVGDAEAARLRAAPDFDFRAWNHGPDSGGSWEDAEAAAVASHPHWAPHLRAYRAHFPASLRGEVPGSVAILRDLHAAGVPVFALTNWSAELYPHAPERFDFLILFHDVVVSGQVGLAKPDPRIFSLLATRAGFPLERLVFIDDRDDNVAAGAAAGLDAILFTDAATLRGDLRRRGLPV